MWSLIATILVLTLLVYIAWPWFWHIATTLILALLVYVAWPWFWQSKPWEDLTSWLQQIEVPRQKASATITPGGRLYVSPQRTHESRTHFEELGEEEYPRAYPRPILVDRWRGNDVFWWKGECWFLRHNEEPYRFLCVVHGKLQWCWQARPNASAVPCRSRDTGEDGWCWGNGGKHNDDS
jgi:hypothetical protein